MCFPRRENAILASGQRGAWVRSTQVSKRLSTDCALCDSELKEKATVRGSVDMVRRVGIRAWPPSLNAVLAGSADNHVAGFFAGFLADFFRQDRELLDGLVFL